MLENCSSELKAVDDMEEMELSAPEQQGQDPTTCSPEKGTCTGFSFTQPGEPKMHQMGTHLQAVAVCGIAGLCLFYRLYSLNITLWNHCCCSFVSLCVLVAKPVFVSMTYVCSAREHTVPMAFLCSCPVVHVAESCEKRLAVEVVASWSVLLQ